MPIVIAVLTLFASLMAAEADAATDTERLAEMFSPILILAEETGHKWGDIKVTKPEPVEIMGAQSADSLWMSSFDLNDDWVTEGVIGDYPSSITFEAFEAKCSKVDFSANKFAFLTSDCFLIHNGIHPNGVAFHGKVRPNFNYPGNTPQEWNDTYFGSGARAGANFPNTAYVHIGTTTIPTYKAQYGPVTVIRYRYFYPYNDWWNNHEGDWQGIDVVVSSRNPATAQFLGVEYRFHEAWLSYYKDYPGNKPGITNSFVFNPERAVRLIGTHPVAYIGAGSHAAYPIGGDIELHFTNISTGNTGTDGASGVVGGDDGASGEIGGDKEYMSHTGLVLSTLADGSHRDLWERYNLVLLPNPDTTNTHNMGLTPAMSWLGAQIRWGEVHVAGPMLADLAGGNASPNGPYNSKTDSWGDLKLFTAKTLKGDTFHHSDLERTSYHHWAILGDETWSGTVSLHGDVVVFPGATLTIQAGTTIVFPSRRDRHQFKEGADGLSELFVYGTLKSEGTRRNPVVLRGPDLSARTVQWGGLRVMGGGRVQLNEHTQVRHTPMPPPPRPTGLTAHAGDGAAILRWDAPAPPDPSITGWQYHTKPERVAQWGPWMDVAGRDTREVLVPNLAHGFRHQFELRAVNLTGGGPASNVASVALMTVALGAANYTLIESGNPLGPQDVSGQAPDPTQAARQVQVIVQVTPATDRPLVIPVGVAPGSAEAEDFRVAGLPAAGLSFGVGATAQRFTLTAHADADRDDETLQCGVIMHRLPVGVWPGAPTQATVTIYDTPSAPTGLTAQGGHAQVTLGWDDPGHADITGWQYQMRPAGGGALWGDWTNVPLSHAHTTTYTVENLAAGVVHWFKVRAVNARGRGAASEPVAATPSAFVLALSGPADTTVVENTPAAWPYTTNVPVGTPVDWWLDGVDKDALRLSPTGQLSFATAPNFERPTDAGKDNRYEVVVRVRTAQYGEASQAVVVRVANQDEAGSVALSTTGPKVGDALTATLADEDGPLTVQQWRWSFFTPAGAAAAVEGALEELVITNPLSKTLPISPVLLGRRIVAHASYTDAFGAGKRVQSDTTAAVVGLPWAPTAFAATAGAGQVVLTWGAPFQLGDTALTRYEYHYKLSGGRWSDWTSVEMATSATVSNLSNGTTYHFAVRAVNRYGAGAAAERSATPQAPFAVSGPQAKTVAEDSTNVGTYTTNAPEGTTVVWALSGPDTSALTLSSAGALSFDSAPNYESPTDAGKNNVYDVAVSAHPNDVTQADTVEVAVTVSNVDEAGRVSLTTTAPQVGTAVTATLTDPDGSITGASWAWDKAAEGEGAEGAEEGEGTYGEADVSSYTPTTSDIGRTLQAKVSYNDGQGTGKKAESAITAAVVDVPAAPSVSATGGDGQTTITWTTPANHGSTITTYEYRHYKNKNSSGSWTSVSNSTSSATISGLTNGTSYTFEVRAKNGVGYGPAGQDTATPQAPFAVSGSKALYRLRTSEESLVGKMALIR